MGRYLDIAHAVAINENNELNELTSTPEIINDPAGPCPHCGSGQWWQRPGKPWQCRSCEPDMPLAATTLTLARHKVEAQSERAHAQLNTGFEAVCKRLSITPESLQNELSDELDSIACGELTAEGLRLVAETLAAEIKKREVLRMLGDNPGITHAVTSDDEIDPEYVIITLAIRGQATCDLRIPKARYDGFKVLELIELNNTPDDESTDLMGQIYQLYAHAE